MQRKFNENEPELMDRVQPVSAELEKDLENLASLNRRFGSHRLVRRFLGAWLQRGRSYTVLDLCTGMGDIPRMMVDWARVRDIGLRIEAIDANAATVEIARKHSADYREITFQRGNVLAFDPGCTFDLVCCSLALHHFNEQNAVRLLRRSRELSHRFVLVADLVRHWSTSAGVWLLTETLYREAMTRHDGRVSAERAFSFGEMRALAETAGWKEFGHARFAPCRQALWLEAPYVTPAPVATDLPAELPLPCPT